MKHFLPPHHFSIHLNQCSHPWRRRQHVPSKCWNKQSKTLHSVKTVRVVTLLHTYQIIEHEALSCKFFGYRTTKSHWLHQAHTVTAPIFVFIFGQNHFSKSAVWMQKWLSGPKFSSCLHRHYYKYSQMCRQMKITVLWCVWSARTALTAQP